jgi:hypothetical protein
MAPGIPNVVTIPAGGSAGVTLATPGVRVRITSSVDCTYRVTKGANTAVSTDNDLPAGTPEYITLLHDQDTVTFYSASAGTAKVAVCAGAS